jgi:hypothetical protein
VDAIRKRVQRGTIAHEKDPDGRVWILLDADRTRHDTGRDTVGRRQDHEPDALISAKDETIATLREQLQAERQAHAEARRLLAAALERIPAIEAPEQKPPRRSRRPQRVRSPGPTRKGIRRAYRGHRAKPGARGGVGCSGGKVGWCRRG